MEIFDHNRASFIKSCTPENGAVHAPPQAILSLGNNHAPTNPFPLFTPSFSLFSRT